jgi:hypothetical protein
VLISDKTDLTDNLLLNAVVPIRSIAKGRGFEF